MSEVKWELREEDGKQVYVHGDFRIVEYRPTMGVGVLWRAYHSGQEVSRDSDLQKVMVHCESLINRIG